MLAAPKKTIVFDIDGVIAGHDTVDDQTVLFFLRKGAVLNAQATHFIFSGILELLKALVDYDGVNLAFFSSGDDQRNHQLIEQLLIKALGVARYAEVKQSIRICSKSDLSVNTKEDGFQLYNEYGISYGNHVKDISKAIALNTNLDNTLFIDDSSSYIKYGQHMSFLCSQSVESSDYQEMIKDGPHSRVSNLHEKINNAFYLSGIVFHILNEADKKGASLSTTSFPIQFKPSENKPFKYQLKYKENWSNSHWYDEGLTRLKTVNPELELCTQENMLQCLAAPETEQESRKIQEAQRHTSKEDCRLM